MMYNKYVSLNKIAEYDSNIDSDPRICLEHKQSTFIREVCRAGLYLLEQLKSVNCHESLLDKIQWTAGVLSYSKDPWEVHNSIFEQYKDNTLILETEEQEDYFHLN